MPRKLRFQEVDRMDLVLPHGMMLRVEEGHLPILVSSEDGGSTSASVERWG